MATGLVKLLTGVGVMPPIIPPAGVARVFAFAFLDELGPGVIAALLLEEEEEEVVVVVVIAEARAARDLLPLPSGITLRMLVGTVAVQPLVMCLMRAVLL
jgi:hypothetical protein